MPRKRSRGELREAIKAGRGKKYFGRFETYQNKAGETVKDNGAYAQTITAPITHLPPASAEELKERLRMLYDAAAANYSAKDRIASALRTLLADHGIADPAAIPPASDMEFPMFLRTAADALAIIKRLPNSEEVLQAITAGRLLEMTYVNLELADAAMTGHNRARANKETGDDRLDEHAPERKNWQTLVEAEIQRQKDTGEKISYVRATDDVALALQRPDGAMIRRYVPNDWTRKKRPS